MTIADKSLIRDDISQRKKRKRNRKKKKNNNFAVNSQTPNVNQALQKCKLQHLRRHSKAANHSTDISSESPKRFWFESEKVNKMDESSFEPFQYVTMSELES
ncbi:hypothetical protein ACTXT7_010826 [Hymenolepis weldensis]